MQAVQVSFKSSEGRGDRVMMISISELAASTGRRPSAIRYYEQQGLLSPAARIGGRRHYHPDARRTIAVIDTARRAGLSLSQIRTLLHASAGNSPAAAVLRELADRRLAEVTALIDNALQVRAWLASAAKCECPELVSCCLFDHATLEQ